jgi:Polyketide cyclase / dehydrase and lipid transport
VFARSRSITTLGMILAALAGICGPIRTIARDLPSRAARGATVGSRSTVPDEWLSSRAVQERLASGAVAIRSVVDGRRASATVEAAIRIHASASTIWPLITQCKFAASLIPGLRRCRMLKSAPDGSWADIEHDIKYSVLVPMVRSVFHADFHPPYRMDFHRIGGSFKYEVGSWTLQPSAEGTTTVQYRVSLRPGFWVPRFIVQRSLRRQLPQALAALRERAQQMAAATAAPPAPRA